MRLLLDLGRVAGPGGMPDLSATGPVDAILLSHMHPDHAGALALAGEAGDPPIHATPLTAASLALDGARPLPLHGEACIAGLTVRTGRNGHAPGGIWLHLGVGDGLLFCGDLAFRSPLYPFDRPPPAASVVLDASFGLRDDPPGLHLRDLAASVAEGGPMLLPAPAWGRGPELALAAHRLGARVALDRPLRDVLAVLASAPAAILPAAMPELAALAREAEAAETAEAGNLVIVTSDPRAEAGATAAWCARLRAVPGAIRFTGHRPPGSAAEGLVASGAATLLSWPVHPMLSENADLLRAVCARQAMAAFCDQALLPGLGRAFGGVALIAGPEMAL
ncbi:MBL fold metallo-hydrolase [soil metagenome]